MYGGLNGSYGECVIVVFLKNVKKTIGMEMRILREASGIER